MRTPAHVIRSVALVVALALAPDPGWAQGRVQLAVRPTAGDLFHFRHAERTRVDVRPLPGADSSDVEGAMFFLPLLLGDTRGEELAMGFEWRCDGVNPDGSVRFTRRLEQFHVSLNMMGAAELQLDLDDSVRVEIRVLRPGIALDSAEKRAIQEQWGAMLAGLSQLRIPLLLSPDGRRIPTAGDDTIATRLTRMGLSELESMIEFGEQVQGNAHETSLPGLVVSYPAVPVAVGDAWSVNDTLRMAADTAILGVQAVTMQLDSTKADTAWLSGRAGASIDGTAMLLAQARRESPDAEREAPAVLRQLFGGFTITSERRVDAAVSLADGMPYASTVSGTTTVEMGRTAALQYTTERVVRVQAPSPQQAALRTD